MIQSAESGRIPCISDSKCYPAAEQIAGNGFSGRCDWHGQMCMQERAGKTNLKKFYDETDKKWKVSMVVLCTLNYLRFRPSAL